MAERIARERSVRLLLGMAVSYGRPEARPVPDSPREECPPGPGSAAVTRGRPRMPLAQTRRDEGLTRSPGGLSIEQLLDEEPQRRRHGLVAPGLHPRGGSACHGRRAETGGSETVHV